MSEPGDITARLRSVLGRLREADGVGAFRQQRLRLWLESVPPEGLPLALDLLEQALVHPKSQWIAAYALDGHFTRDVHPSLTPEIQRALMKKLSDRFLGAAELDDLVRRLTDGPPARALVEEVLAPARAPSFGNAHAAFVAALRAAPIEALPPGPYHRGGAAPSLGGGGTVALALFLARAVEHTVPAKDRRQFDAVVTLASEALAAGRGEVSKALEQAAGKDAKVPQLSIARAAAVEARGWYRRPDLVGTSLRAVAPKAVNVLLEADGVDAVRAMLVAMDDAIMRLCVSWALSSKNKTPTRPIARGVWFNTIKVSSSGARQGLWLGQMDDGRYGLLSKVGPRWTWTEGARDDVLATVPDVLFEEAVMAAREGE